MKIGESTFFFLYLGIGALLHAIFLGARPDWSSVWTYGVIFGWPAIAFVVACALMLIGWLAAVAFMFILRRIEARRFRRGAR